MKKTFVKILNVFFCALLIVTLAIPCFADPLDLEKGGGTKSLVSLPSQYEGDHYYDSTHFALGNVDPDDPSYTAADCINDSFGTSYDSATQLYSLFSCREFDFLIGDGYYTVTTNSQFFTSVDHFGYFLYSNLYFTPDLSYCCLFLPTVYSVSSDGVTLNLDWASPISFGIDEDYNYDRFVYTNGLTSTLPIYSMCYRFNFRNGSFTFGDYNSYDTRITSSNFDYMYTFAYQDMLDSLYTIRDDHGLFPWIESNFLPLFGEIPTDEIDMGIFGSWSPLQLVRAALWVSLGGVCVSAFVVLPFVLLLRLTGIKKRRKGSGKG